ncbi:hypothetical protein N7G274_007629 [Stereocaulon virgatum]|uniref:Uncharacterized protein n=1 Tax=Stereocaulon virgatum TaxID=373712 RepID=A0ABR4A1M1_9LECA
MPPDCLHLTVLEMAHSRTEAEIAAMAQEMEGKIPKIVDFTYYHCARLVKPMLNYDTAAIALSFLPAARESLPGYQITSDAYNSHHLRPHLSALCESAGIEVASRYVVQSAHLTIARFVTQIGHAKEGDLGPESKYVAGLIKKLEDLNVNHKSLYWGKEADDWTVGTEKGLVCRRGTVWYGGGETLHQGRGFDTYRRQTILFVIKDSDRHLPL